MSPVQVLLKWNSLHLGVENSHMLLEGFVLDRGGSNGEHPRVAVIQQGTYHPVLGAAAVGHCRALVPKEAGRWNGERKKQPQCLALQVMPSAGTES